MDTTHPIRIGLVGCGWHGSTLAKAVERSGALRLVAAADPDADAVVLVVGTDLEWEAEGHDRAALELPGAQDELVARVLAVR
ncbi:MAG TPA: glycoside hydrolase family 3 C-terminal domain-containing protein, partial [Microlunatus sp.]|nr:glycoside hydrolase family 3 C-terminal domain-containing protein [Microlunatus sp.]